MTSHIAQLNIGRFRYPTDDPRMADFMNNLDRVNALAERSEGFVWRLKDDSNNATAIRPFDRSEYGGQPVGLGKRRSAGALCLGRRCTSSFYGRKRDWFDKLGTSAFRHVVDSRRASADLDEAKERLEHLDTQGDSDFAFGWSHLAHIKLWLSRKCG